MSTVPDKTAADFEGLAAERKPIGNGGGRHLMVRVGDELTGQIVKSEIVTGKYGDFAVLKVEPVKATASIRPTGVKSSCAAPATPSRSGTSARSRKPMTWCRFNSPSSSTPARTRR
jgi:hypothetical protein